MFNRQMFGMKKLTTNHPTPWNERPKLPLSNWTKNFHTTSVPHYELIAIESSWFHLCIGEEWISKN